MTISKLGPPRGYFTRIAMRDEIGVFLPNDACRIPLRYDPHATDVLDLNRTPTPHRIMHYLLVLPPPEHPEWLQVEYALWHLATRCGLRTVDAAIIRLGDGSPALLYEIRGHTYAGMPSANTASHLMNFRDRETIESIGRVLCRNCGYPRIAAVDYFDLILFAYLTGDCDLGGSDFNLLHIKMYDGFRIEGGFHFLPRKILDGEETEGLELFECGSSRDAFANLAECLKLSVAQRTMRIRRLIDSIASRMDDKAIWSAVPEPILANLRSFIRSKMAEFTK